MPEKPVQSEPAPYRNSSFTDRRAAREAAELANGGPLATRRKMTYRAGIDAESGEGVRRVQA